MSKLSEEIIRLHNEGRSYRDIQTTLGCSKGTIAYHLGEGQKDKHAQRQRDKRGQIKKYLQDVKQNSVCADCKENYPYWIMEFDHLGDKSFDLCRWATATSNLEIVKLEVAKCEVVCSNCHKNRTHYRSWKNGSNSPNITEYYAGMV